MRSECSECDKGHRRRPQKAYRIRAMGERVCNTPTWVLPRIDAARCTGCGQCQALCPAQAVEVIDGLAVITRPAACTYCEVCESFCPEGAIGRPFVVVFSAQAGRPLEQNPRT